MPWQCGVGKIYDPELLYSQKQDDYFKKEYELKFTGIGNRVFKDELLLQCVDLGATYLNTPTSLYTEKLIGCDPGWRGSKFGIVVVELVDGNIRVLFADHFERKNTQVMIDKILELRAQFRNVKNIFIDISQSEFIVDLKTAFENLGYEYPENYTERIREWWRDYKKQPWEMGMYVIPSNFGAGGKIQYTQRLKKAMSNGNYWIHESFDKLLLAYETSVSKEDDENNIDKDHQENSDICDAQLTIFRKLKPL